MTADAIHMLKTTAWAWIVDHSLNMWAYLSLLAMRPLRAKSAVEWAASVYPPIGSVAEARRAAYRVRRRGTCLSRSLAIAARFPGSVVVIGVRTTPDAKITGPTSLKSIDAHAWVEIEGVALLDEERRSWTEVGRLDLPTKRSHPRRN
jgi:hypothetical protein